MMLSPTEIDKMHIFMAADIARRRQKKDLELNYVEAVAIISDHITNGARAKADRFLS
jgi:urease gamma subunit